MVALIIEEASDQCGVANELLRISRCFQDHIGPVVAVEERGTAEDMKTSSAAMSTWRDEICPRREVRSWITGVVGHWQWVEIGVTGEWRLVWWRSRSRNRGGLCCRRWNGKVRSRGSNFRRFSFIAENQCLGSLG
jgi:hypothetical protein